MNEKILILGGSFLQIPLIDLAKKRGCYVITCDYLPDNPGHKLSHEYHNVSTTDKEAVLYLAKKLEIDAIIAYASDPAVPTAAYVADALGLHSPSSDAVNILARKDLFRDFLLKNGFDSPKAGVFDSFDQAKQFLHAFDLPVIVKPVDSSGSKGISKVYEESALVNACYDALRYSRCKKIIIEEFIERICPQVHGDAFVLNSELVFTCLGDHYFINENSFVPVSTMIPTQCAPKFVTRALLDINKILKIIKFGTGPINIEIAIGRNNKVYIMEIGPRNGGNFVPQLIQYATRAEMVSWVLDSSLGNIIQNNVYYNSFRPDGFYSHYIIHSEMNGVFDRIEIDTFIAKKILMKKIYKKHNDTIKSFTGSDSTVGVLILKYDSLEEMHSTIKEMPNYLKIFLK